EAGEIEVVVVGHRAVLQQQLDDRSIARAAVGCGDRAAERRPAGRPGPLRHQVTRRAELVDLRREVDRQYGTSSASQRNCISGAAALQTRAYSPTKPGATTSLSLSRVEPKELFRLRSSAN